jgi:hypothetical protein
LYAVFCIFPLFFSKRGMSLRQGEFVLAAKIERGMKREICRTPSDREGQSYRLLCVNGKGGWLPRKGVLRKFSIDNQ